MHRSAIAPFATGWKKSFPSPLVPDSPYLLVRTFSDAPGAGIRGERLSTLTARPAVVQED